MTKFEEEFNYLIELSGKVLIGKVDAEEFEKNRIAFFEKYETDQQQALPVVPEYVGEFIEDCKKEGDCLFGILADAKRFEHDMPDLVYFWMDDECNNELFARAWFNGYTVEKPQLFYLKAKELLVVGDYDHVDDLRLDWNKNFTTKKLYAHKFTQSEIDSMPTESYELVPVEDGE